MTLGTIPDFAFSGNGYRLAGVIPSSPAETAGLREGDIITKINSSVVGGVRDLSRILKALAPGSRITVIFVREGKEMTVGAELKER